MSLKVSFNNVSKKFNLSKNKSGKIKQLIFPDKSAEGFFGVRNVSFDVCKGETIGFVGINGSGKSTMSNLIAQMISPTFGDIEMDGQPSLIAIAAGLNNNLTGRDNIYLKCLMMGFSNKEIKEIYESIVEFADIGEFIDQPVKSYSSGMKSRLGFAISVHNDPDILIIDEALSVGDQTFYQKCVDKITDFKKQGKIIFFVSHSIGQIEKICDRVAWMHYGRLIMFGKTKNVVTKYKEFIDRYNKLSKKQKAEYQFKHKEERKKPLEITELGNLNRKKAKSNRKKHSSFVQLLILSSLCLFIGVTLFIDKPLRTIVSAGAITIESEKNESISSNKKEKDWKAVRKEGYLINPTVHLFKDKGLENVSNLALLFGEKVNVKAKNADMYRIDYKDKEYYIKMTDISFLESESQAEISPADFSPYFPEKILNSYEFLLAFLGADKEELQSNVSGMFREIRGKEAFYLPNEDLYYILESSKSTGLIVPNMPKLTPNLLKLKDEQVVYSLDKNTFLIPGDNFNYTVNNQENTLTILAAE